MKALRWLISALSGTLEIEADTERMRELNRKYDEIEELWKSGDTSRYWAELGKWQRELSESRRQSLDQLRAKQQPTLANVFGDALLLVTLVLPWLVLLHWLTR